MEHKKKTLSFASTMLQFSKQVTTTHRPLTYHNKHYMVVRALNLSHENVCFRAMINILLCNFLLCKFIINKKKNTYFETNSYGV